MIQYRHGVFETNSSSSHSIIVSSKDDYYTKEEIERYIDRSYKDEGLVKFWNDDELTFRRYPFDILTTFEDKLRYVIASYSWDDKIPEEVYEVCREVIEGFKGFEFPEVFDHWDEDGNYVKVEYRGDVDHQSCELLKSFLLKYKITLRDFLLNKRYVVIIDGDEYNTRYKLLNLDFIDYSKIDMIYGIYGEWELTHDTD